MKNRITKSVPFLVAITGKAIGGLTHYASEVPTKYIDAELLGAKLELLTAADNHYQQGKGELQGLRAHLYALTATIRQFVYVARDVCKPFLGNTYSAQWEAFGLRGSLEVPRAVRDLVPLLHSIEGFYTSNPGQQNPLLQATAQRAAELHAGLVAADNSVNHQLDVVLRLYRERDLAAAALQSALRLLLKELGIVLEPLDPRWISFGFKKPGAKQAPDRPEQVSVVMVDNDTAAVEWEPTPRAKGYRVRASVVGSDAEPVLIGSPRDPDIMLRKLPSDAEVEVLISAVNAGGEGHATRVIIRTGASGDKEAAGLDWNQINSQSTIADSQPTALHESPALCFAVALGDRKAPSHAEGFAGHL